MYSTGVSQRSWTRTDCAVGWRSSEQTLLLQGQLLICRRASVNRQPGKLPAASVIRPSRPMASTSGSLWVYHQLTSALSPKVQHITAPVPFCGSAAGSARTGTSLAEERHAAAAARPDPGSAHRPDGRRPPRRPAAAPGGWWRWAGMLATVCHRAESKRRVTNSLCALQVVQLGLGDGGLAFRAPDGRRLAR